MIQSNGVLLKSPTVVWQGSPRTWGNWPASMDLGFRWASYGAIYRSHLWVAVLVNKLANATARLPLKVYQRAADTDRQSAADTPYGRLLARPNQHDDPFTFWLWTASTVFTYGEAFWGKVRDRGGRPVELIRLHPTNIIHEDVDGKTSWRYDNGTHRSDIDRRDLVHFKLYSPDSDTRGMSPLEPLRSTLENEEGARKANSALWRNGGRPSVFLETDKTLSDPAQQRVAANWSAIHGGVDNWAKAAVLEEGMKARTVQLNAEELQYVEARKLNREEACAIYDVPPPVVGIHDRSTFNNVVELMRSMYRDTMAPKLRLFESTLDFELRDGRFGADGTQDFGDAYYAEFLMDEVLRGDFEDRLAAYQKADFMTLAEKRAKENLPFIEGTDRIFLNSATLPLDTDGNLQPPVTEPPASLPADVVRSIMGRLSRAATLDDVNRDALTSGLNGATPLVLATLDASSDLADLKARLRALVKE